MQDERKPIGKRTIVCLCGSTRLKEAFEEANRRETLGGKIVLSVGLFGSTLRSAGAELEATFTRLA